MMKRALFIAALLFPSVACAEETPPVSDKICKILHIHNPAPDVAYQAGVDVHGKSVAEADIELPVVMMPETFSFDVTVDVAEYLGLPVSGAEGQVTVGTVSYDKEGYLSFNGQPLAPQQKAQLNKLCLNK